jgi:hypothetical protein
MDMSVPTGMLGRTPNGEIIAVSDRDSGDVGMSGVALVPAGVAAPDNPGVADT